MAEFKSPALIYNIQYIILIVFCSQLLDEKMKLVEKLMYSVVDNQGETAEIDRCIINLIRHHQSVHKSE